MNRFLLPTMLTVITILYAEQQLRAEQPLRLDNGNVQVGIDREKGGAITWLSWKEYPKNMVNSADPGRLIQQSYYAGRSLDRTSEGQNEAWSPWTWNPIQGGGVGASGGTGSWAHVLEFQLVENHTLYAETIPKLWDMSNEEADAIMRQWTALDSAMENVIVVTCEIVCSRKDNDRWGDPVSRPQEVPACYFTRNFGSVKSYLGDHKWRAESQPPGPPWGQADPPRKAMALFTDDGQGVAVFSPSATKPWNFGPHGHGSSEDPLAGPCMHVAPLDQVSLGTSSSYRYRYWIVVGNETEIASTLDQLWNQHANEKARFTPQ